MTDQRALDGGRTCRVLDEATTAKVGIPELPGWVISRPRLMARIGKGCRGPLTVVTGAPGAGKTVAAASWAAADSGAHDLAWVTVDDGDGDPDVFWRYLVEALRRAGVEVPAVDRSPLRSDGIDHVRIAELASALCHRDRPVVLVLDDFRPAVGSVLVSGMVYLLKLARPWLRLVITSRRDLPLPLHRYRLTGDLTEIRAEDLAFTERETDQLLAQHGVVLRRESMRALREMTEGWAAGLRLAAMSMDGHPDPDDFVAQAGSGDHAMAGYLVEEVLDAQRPEVRRLLLTTSILDRVNAEIAAELTDGVSGGEFCELAEQNAFVRPLGHGWYRYHQMFRDVLRLRLRHENPGRAATLHRRAASWFSARGLITEAVQHAAAAQDWRLACELVVDQLAVGDLLGLRPAPRLLAALSRMPAAERGEGLEPALVGAALGLADGDESSCRSALARADALLADRPESDAAAARLTAALVRLVHAGTHEEVGVRSAAAEVGKLIERVPHDLLKARPEVRSLASAGRGVTELWAGQWAQAGESLAAACATAVEADSLSLRLDCLGYGALAEGFRGRWGRASELVAQAARLTPAPVPAGSRAAVLATARAFVALEHYQLAEARHEIDQAGPTLLGLSHPMLAAVRGLASARIDLAAGHDDRAGETLRRIGTGSATPPWLIRRLLLVQAEVHAAAGAPAAAWQAAIRAGGAHTADGAVALARVQLAVSRPDAASTMLRPALTDAVAARSDIRIEAWLLDAQASYALGNPSRGRRSLDRALRLGDREQLRLPLVAYSPWLRVVLRTDQELARRYSRLLEPLRIGPGAHPAPDDAADRGPLLSRQLSDRELEVLRHLAQMRTSEEIAAEMFVSINTVKTHLKSIYRKLAVTRRGDAVRRAHQLDLLTGARVPQQRSHPGGSEQAEFPGAPDGLGAGGDTELAIDQAGVALDRVHGDE